MYSRRNQHKVCDFSLRLKKACNRKIPDLVGRYRPFSTFRKTGMTKNTWRLCICKGGRVGEKFTVSQTWVLTRPALWLYR